MVSRQATQSYWPKACIMQFFVLYFDVRRFYFLGFFKVYNLTWWWGSRETIHKYKLSIFIISFYKLLVYNFNETIPFISRLNTKYSLKVELDLFRGSIIEFYSHTIMSYSNIDCLHFGLGTHYNLIKGVHIQMRLIL